MHEASLAMGMAQNLIDVARRNGAKEVLKVRVKIGPLSGVVIDSFVFAFDAIKREHPLLKNTKLEVLESTARYICLDCGKEFETKDVRFPECPNCGSLNLKMVSGDELEVVDIEIEV